MDFAFTQALKQLADDVQIIAAAWRGSKRHRVLQILEDQNNKGAELAQDEELGAQLDLMIQKAIAGLQPTPASAPSPPAQ